MTGRELVSAALRLIGAVASGETLEASEATDGLAAINRMISSWSTEGLLIYTKVREEFSLTPSTGSYTMGTGANFNTSRPLKIEAAAIEIQTNTPNYEVPLRILTVQEWAAITNKDLTSTIPTDLYPAGTYPNETLYLYPVPSAAHKLVLYSSKPLTEIATLDTSISLPPGYERALVFNGAMELAPEYGKTVDAMVLKGASESKANLKVANHKPSLLQVDSALRPSRSFNIITGEY